MTITRVRTPFIATPVLLLMATIFVAGCAVGPKYKLPTVTAPPAYKESANWKPAQPNEQQLGGNWWEIFQDPQLNTLEQQINVSNQNLKVAVAQYQESRAALRYVRADYFPTITASPSATRQQYSNNRPPSSNYDGLTFNGRVEDWRGIPKVQPSRCSPFPLGVPQ